MEANNIQEWLAQRKKCVGPPCVQEANPNEATWFIESIYPRKWAFPWFVESKEIEKEWCLPIDIFNKLQGFIVNRRDGGFHNQWAKSWNTKEEAESALSAVLFKLEAKKNRSIQDDWEPSLKF